MKRDLLIQMRNEWRENLRLVIGLTIVTLAIWWLSLKLYDGVKGLFHPTGFDVEDVYKVSLNMLDQDSPDFKVRAPEDAEAQDAQDLRMLIANIRKSPYVEAAAFSENGLPYILSYYGTGLYLDMEPKDTIGYSTNLRFASPDIVRVLRIKSRTGKSSGELENYLRNGELLVSNILIAWGNQSRTPEDLLGKAVHIGGDSLTHRVGDIIDQVRRSDYDLISGGMSIIPIDESTTRITRAWEIGIRMKPGMGEKFREAFESDPSLQAFGNRYLTKLTKLTDEGKYVQKRQSTDARMGIALMIALLVIIALGLLGVFWFRMQQRVSEIAIRKVCGASSGDIFRRVISEGMLLLLAASLLGGIIGWGLLRSTLMKEDGIDITTVAIAECITILVTAIGITVSLWWPAKKAMSIEPAIAIKDE